MRVGEVAQVFFVVDGMLTEMLTVKQAAYRLKYSVRTLQQWISEDKLIAINVDGRNWIPVSEIYRINARDSCNQLVAQ